MSEKKAFIWTHLGLGDIILCYSLVEYIARNYDSVVVLILQPNLNTLEVIFNNNPKIRLHPVVPGSEVDISPFKDYDIYLTGCHASKPVDLSLFPLSFYDDVKVPRTEFLKKASFNRSQESLELYNKIKDIPYIVVNNHCSNGFLFNAVKTLRYLDINIDTTLVVNTHNNIYKKDHPFYPLAQLFLEHRPLTDYCYVLENAEMLILTDSAMCCLTHLLDIKSKKNFVFSRNNVSFRRIYDGDVYSLHTKASDISVKYEYLDKSKCV